MSESIHSLSMPKWGMTMTEGTLVEWRVQEGDEVSIGDEVAEVETEKMIGPVEAQVSGILRRRIAAEGDVVRVGGMLAVIAPAGASEEKIDAFVERETAERAAAEAVRVAPRPESVSTSLGPVRAVGLGDGSEAVVFLHGFGGDALNWRFNIEELHGVRRVIAIDLPGHGESTKDVGGGAADELASVAWETLEALGVSRVHLVGHSLGALLAARLAAGHPDEVASLALIAPAGFGHNINADFIDGFAAASSRRELKVVLPLLFVDQSLVGRELVEEVLRYKRASGVSEALTTIRDRLFPSGTQAVSVIEDVAGLDVPTLVLWGANDRVITADQARAAPADARVEVLEGVGHSPHIEAAAEVNARLAEFLSQVEPVPSP